MGIDKASLGVAGSSPLSGRKRRPVTLAERTAALLEQVCAAAVEVGPGHTALPSVMESPPGRGPLVAMACGWEALQAGGWNGPVLVVATDLPALTSAFLRWLVAYAGDRSVVPVAGGRVQPLCARYSATDMTLAAELAADGERAMAALLRRTEPVLAGEFEWAAAAGPEVLSDADTPEDLARLRKGEANK
jgi:molybdopterin-guanine dinucleotide biosynthesis protein A